jgi:hypothetical protein
LATFLTNEGREELANAIENEPALAMPTFGFPGWDEWIRKRWARVAAASRIALPALEQHRWAFFLDDFTLDDEVGAMIQALAARSIRSRIIVSSPEPITAVPSGAAIVRT